MTTEPSIFTKIINRDIPGFIAFETENVAVLISLEGHPLVIPKREYRDVYELPDEIAAEVMQIAVKVAKALKHATNCAGINLVQSNGPVAGHNKFFISICILSRVLSTMMSSLNGILTRRPKLNDRPCAKVWKKYY